MKNSTFFKLFLSTVLFLGVTIIMNAQLQNTNWYFGNQTGLNFNDGTQPATIITNNIMSSNGGTAAVSDEFGNLLFYTDGITIWNKFNMVIYNGFGLYGSTSVSQSVIIVPKPNDPNLYYIFTNQGQQLFTKGLRYSLVDLIGIYGIHVETFVKNVPLLSRASEKLTAVYNPIDNSYWVVSFAPSTDPNVSDTFYSYKVDFTGVNLRAQSSFTFPFTPNVQFSGGQMKISQDGTALAMAHNTIDVDARYGIQNYTSLFTFDFDLITGEVTAMNSSFICNQFNYYGIEFSPDGNLLYVTGTHKMSDSNVFPVIEEEMGTLYQIPFRSQTQENMGTTLYEGLDPIYALQLGIDGKIYAVNSSGNLGIINNANTEGFGANYEHERIDLNGKATRELPQFIPMVIFDLIPEQKSYTILSNPFKTSLNIQFNKMDIFKLKLYNSYGVKMKEIDYDIFYDGQITSLKTTELLSGVYFLNIKDSNNKQYYETLIKN